MSAANRSTARHLARGTAPAGPGEHHGPVRVAPHIGDWDRNPLSDAERAALALRVGPSGRLTKQAKEAIERLTSPVGAALRVFHPNVGARSRRNEQVVAHVLLAMHHRQRAFWEFTDDDWREELASAPKLYRATLAAIAYVLGGATPHRYVANLNTSNFAPLVFGCERVERAWTSITAVLAGWGYGGADGNQRSRRACVSYLLLETRSTDLGTITLSHLQGAAEQKRHFASFVNGISKALYHLGHLPAPLPDRQRGRAARVDHEAGMAPEWARVVRATMATTVASKSHKTQMATTARDFGRWLSATHPDVTGPDLLKPEVLASWVAMVCESTTLQWSAPGDQSSVAADKLGKQLMPRTIAARIRSLRSFLRLCRKYKVARMPEIDIDSDLEIPAAIQRLIGPDPRDIRVTIWAKLVHASLNLSDEAIAAAFRLPVPMVRALAVLWTHAGLRSDEYARLYLGCTRPCDPAIDRTILDGAPGEVLNLADHICVLDVPANKTAPAYSKPVGKIVAGVVAQWEAVRPSQPRLLDKKVNAPVHFLFAIRGRRINKSFFNKKLIPWLCARAGVPVEDVPGKKITCHRGRASLATWLFNTTEGMTLEELRMWMGHRSIASTANYARTSARKLAIKFAKAQESAHLIEVLVDLERLATGDTSRAAVYFPLGNDDHCENPFFSRCPHKLACIKCDFYKASDSQEASMLRASKRYVRMLTALPLDDEERRILEECKGALDKAAEKIRRERANVPAPDGSLPRPGGPATRTLPVLN